ncbi:MAG: PorV/PorQ family protein, partial [Bacteroidota bacterium]
LAVVAAPRYYGSAAQMNPALFARDQEAFGINYTYTPWLRALGVPDMTMMDLNAFANTDRIGIGLNVRYFDLGQINITDPLGQPIGSANPSELRLSGSVALRITDHLSAGVGLQYFHSGLGSNGNIDPGFRGNGLNSIAANMGVFYQKTFDISNQLSLRNSWGLSITNLGPKVTYLPDLAPRDFIPINLSFGIMEGLHYQLEEEMALGFDFGIQMQKLMVPSEGGRSDLPLFRGMIGSFFDAPLTEEFASINWQLGAEGRFEGPANSIFALRTGAFLETAEFGNRKFMTFGASAGIIGLRLDASYIRTFSQNHPLQNTLRLALGYTFWLDKE